MYNSIEIQILVNGKPVKKYSHNGRTFIRASKGTTYSILLKNHDNKRKLFRVSVDGIDVINGKPAGNSESGYIIDGYNSYEVKGFRTSNDSVNQFVFNDKKRSYAALSEETNGDTSNCGVIGIKVFDEKVNQVIKISYPPQEQLPIYKGYDSTICDMSSYTVSACNNVPETRSINASFSCMSRKAVNNFDMGTQFSDIEVNDVVTNGEFEIGFQTNQVLIYYASVNALESMGVPIVKKTKIVGTKAPQAFPSSFCKPPKCQLKH